MDEREAIAIGIDARAAAEVPAGRGRVVRELLSALAARDDRCSYLLYAREPWSGCTLDERFRWRLIDAGDPWWHVRAARAANRECDVFLSTNSYLTVWMLRVPAVPIVYDMIPFEAAMLPNRRSAAIERLTLGFAVRRATAFLAISQATAEALAARFPATLGRIIVATLGASLAADARLDPEERRALPEPGFVLAVGTLEPRKNLPRLVAAYSRLGSELQERHPLVVVGPSGWEAGATLHALRSLGERCTVLGYVSDAALAELYSRCAVFCYLSLGEGFGLPVLEAMTHGAAVLTSNVSSLPEVGGAAVEYADPREVSSIAAAMRRVLTDANRREELGALARARAAEFSWDGFAQRVLEALEEACRDG